MIAENIFTNNTRFRILQVFLMEGEGMIHVRGLVRKIDGQMNSVRRELENLEQCGIIEHKNVGVKKFFHLCDSVESRKYQSALKVLFR